MIFYHRICLIVLNLRIDVVFILIKQTNQPLSPGASRAQFQCSGAKSVIGKRSAHFLIFVITDLRTFGSAFRG